MIVPTDKQPQDNEERLSKELFDKQIIRLQDVFRYSLSDNQKIAYFHELKSFGDRGFMLAVNRIILNDNKFPFISDFGIVNPSMAAEKGFL